VKEIRENLWLKSKSASKSPYSPNNKLNQEEKTGQQVEMVCGDARQKGVQERIGKQEEKVNGDGGGRAVARFSQKKKTATNKIPNISISGSNIQTLGKPGGLIKTLGKKEIFVWREEKQVHLNNKSAATRKSQEGESKSLLFPRKLHHIKSQGEKRKSREESTFPRT